MSAGRGSPEASSPSPKSPLKGLRVIVTRPLKQAEVWCEKLRDLGACTATVPVLALQAVTDAEPVQAIKNVVLDFDLYQKAIFVSQNAVDFALQWLEDYWPQLPQGTEYFAVGETTARSLQAYGLTVSALTATNSGAMNSESLLQAPELQQVSGEKIVIFRGCGGRGQMADVLRERGASVTYCELYERVIPALAGQDLCIAFGTDEVWTMPQVIALHSGESLQHFMQVLAGIDARDLDTRRIMQLIVLVPGERVAQLARDAGFTRILVAENATDQAMSAALLAHLNVAQQADLNFSDERETNQ